MKRFILISACSCAVLASLGQPASAKENENFSWSGFYVGANLGYGKESGSVRHRWFQAPRAMASSLNVGAYPATKTAYSLNGPLAGVFLGFNHQFNNNLVLGFDIDGALSKYTKLFLREDSSNDKSHLTNNSRKISKAGESEYCADWRVGTQLRLGYSFGRFLPYIAAGVNFLNMKMHDAEQNVKTYEVAIIERNQLLGGASIAGGADIGLTDNLFMRAEYRYNFYRDTDKDFYRDNNSGVKRMMTLSGQELRLGLAYKF